MSGRRREDPCDFCKAIRPITKVKLLDRNGEIATYDLCDDCRDSDEVEAACVDENPGPSNKPPRDFGKAMKKYLEFHKLDPKDIGTFASLTIPSRFYYVGEATHVMYRSDKWENKQHNYIHEHDANVKCVRSDARGVGIPIEVPSYIQNAKTLYRLGECLGFAYMTEDGEVKAKCSRPYPELYAIPSGRAILVVDTVGSRAKLVAIMFGGKLNVRDVGIVG